MSIKKRRILLYILAVMIPALLTHNRCGLYAQPGGNNTWEFLNLTSSARVASLGGKNISLRDGDPGLIFHNPSLLDSTMHNHLSLNYVNYLADINYGYALWAFHHRRLGSFAAGIHYIDYGSFLAADHTGNITGNFTARENSFNLSWATALDSLFTFGATLKGISSSFEQYHSWGMALDAGINYYNPARLLSASVVMKNLGTQFSTWYAGGEKEPLPFELQLGLTKQLAHAPFRFSIVYQHLQDFNLQGKRPEGDQAPRDQSLSRKLDDFGSEFIRHLVAGVEFIPVQSFAVNIGYNSLRRHELKIDDKASTAGFSWGFNLQITRFRVGFGQARYHLAGSSSHFSVTTNLASLYSR
jgi:hypothetical protein